MRRCSPAIAHPERAAKLLRGCLSWIAPMTVRSGEDALRALAEGGFRGLDGEEEAAQFRASAAPDP